MEEKYDVAVYGLWYGNNYGSIITYYALTRVLEEMNLSYAMIRNPLGREIDIDSLSRSHPLKFARNHYKITPLLPLSRLSELNDNFSAFLLGSDQMWNYGLSRPYGQSYFFDFVAPEKIKVAYATSFGRDKYTGPDEEKEITYKNLHRFHGISVRDDFSKRICEEDFDIFPELLLDPVFLCPVKEYEELINEPGGFKIDEEYIFAYILDPNPEIGKSIQNIAEQTQKWVIVAFNQSGDKEQFRLRLNITSDLVTYELDPTVNEWLYLYKKSQYVLTDSFHGACFSIIYEKPFIVLKNNGRGGSRFPSLLGELGLLDRMVERPEDFVTKFKNIGLNLKVDYKKVRQILDERKKISLDWLNRALNISKQEISPENVPNNTVISKINKHMCMGCGACVSICPYNAIVLKADSMGYYRSCIDYKKCVNCGMCSKVCPACKLPENRNEKNPTCFAFAAADDSVLYASSSGGAFPVLANEVFARDGIVVGAAWKDDFSVEHIMIGEKSQLYKLQKSKYLQSYLGDIFRRIKEKLEENIFVLFSGCPCQVAGLKAYLNRDYDNLLLVDLLCGNSPSALFFRKYIEDSFPEGVKKYEFRHKEQGWNWDCVTVTVTDGSSVVRRGGAEDEYQRVYHNHTMCAPHCESCRYQEAPRFGDLTIGDFWGIGKKDKTIDTQKGVSAILCNNEKGRKYLESIAQENIGLKKEVPLSWLGGNGYAFNGSHNYCSSKRDAFYNAIGKMPFRQAVNYVLKPNHGIYRKVENLSPLCYDSKALHFHFDESIWEEHYVMGATCLLVKEKKAPKGRYATLSLNSALEKGKPYILKARFKIRTESSCLYFHIKDSGSGYCQVIYNHKVKKGEPGWEEIEVSFVPKADIYDEFMFGASQITGEGNFLVIDYINIVSV